MSRDTFNDHESGWSNGAIVPLVEIDFDDMDRRNGWVEAEGTEPICAAEVLDQLLKIGAWAEGSAARRAVVQIKIQGDHRSIPEIAREHHVDSSAVYRALSEYQNCLTGTDGFCSSLNVGRKRVTKRRKTKSILVTV